MKKYLSNGRVSISVHVGVLVCQGYVLLLPGRWTRQWEKTGGSSVSHGGVSISVLVGVLVCPGFCFTAPPTVDLAVGKYSGGSRVSHGGVSINVHVGVLAC